MKININLLKEHPLNHQIYGDDDEKQLNDLVERIRSSGYVKAILVIKDVINDYTIISGHRRVRACKVLKMESIECEFIEGDEEKLIEIFLNENHYRQKTNRQLEQEGRFYFDIERKKALQRQLAGLDLGVPETQGRTNEIVADKLGMSESSFKKLRKVGKKIDVEENPEIKWFFSEAVDENITATSKLVEKPYEFIQDVIEKVDGDFKTVGKVIRQLEQEEIKKQTALPPVKCQIIYADLTNGLTESLTKLPISDIGEDDSVLLLWVKPEQLKTSLQLIENWNFKYQTCQVWNKDIFEVSDNAEILMISTKGDPPMIPQTKESPDDITPKPKMVRQMIENNFGGSIVELVFDESTINQWKLWDRQEL